MRARIFAGFALGFALGLLSLGLVLWATGSLKVAPVGIWSASAKNPPPAAYTVPDAPEAGAPGHGAPGNLITPPALPDPTPPMVAANPTAPPLTGKPAPILPDAPEPPAAVVPRAGEADRMLQVPRMHLRMPLDGIDRDLLTDTFSDPRGDSHPHEALDIMAPKGTPVRAVADGNVVKLFTSKQGGITVYQFDTSRTWCYYYAHLDRYATGLKEGTLLRAGDVIGYVGTTGNAPPGAPHLHLAIFELGPEKKWWEGKPVNPYPLLK